MQAPGAPAWPFPLGSNSPGIFLQGYVQTNNSDTSHFLFAPMHWVNPPMNEVQNVIFFFELDTGILPI